MPSERAGLKGPRPLISPGKPKAVLHTTAGYAVGAAATFKYVFDYKASAHREDAIRSHTNPNQEFFVECPIVKMKPQMILRSITINK